MLAIAVPQGGDQFGVLLTPPGMEPLLELVQDQQHLLTGAQDASLPHAASESTSPILRRQFGTDLPQALQQPGFGLLRGRLDVNRQGRASPAGAEAPP